MSGNLSWEPKTQSETCFRYADFTDELATGEIITGTPTVTVTVWSGNDPAPNIINAVTVLNNTAGLATVARVQLKAGVLGTLYQVVVTAVTSLGNSITKAAVLVIKPFVN